MHLPDERTLALRLNAAWPGSVVHDTGSWLLRSASGVTQRANSVLPYAPVADVRGAVDEAESWYRSQRLIPNFTIPGFTDPALIAELDRRGYRSQSATRYFVRPAGLGPLGNALPEGFRLPEGLELHESASLPEVWFDSWFATQPYSGPEAKEAARQLLTVVPSRYVWITESTHDAGASPLAPIARMHVVLEPNSVGLFSLHTEPAWRRRGLAQTLIARAANGSEAWLAVEASNTGAIALYEGLGFMDAGGYLYRQPGLRRSATGC